MLTQLNRTFPIQAQLKGLFRELTCFNRPERGASASYAIAASVSRFFASLADAIVDWNDARLTRKSLEALSDRELDDIGLTRADIHAVARGNY